MEREAVWARTSSSGIMSFIIRHICSFSITKPSRDQYQPFNSYPIQYWSDQNDSDVSHGEINPTKMIMRRRNREKKSTLECYISCSITLNRDYSLISVETMCKYLSLLTTSHIFIKLFRVQSLQTGFRGWGSVCLTSFNWKMYDETTFDPGWFLSLLNTRWSIFRMLRATQHSR